MGDKDKPEWYCEGCGANLTDKEVELYDVKQESHCHVIALPVSEYEWEPQPCGPVFPIPF